MKTTLETSEDENYTRNECVHLSVCVMFAHAHLCHVYILVHHRHLPEGILCSGLTARGELSTLGALLF